MSEARPPAPDGVISLPDAAATERAGQALGHALETVLGLRHAGAAAVVGLAGGLGAGKTTLARASLRALGVGGTVRSPTYTIAEPYETRIGCIWHLPGSVPDRRSRRARVHRDPRSRLGVCRVSRRMA